MCAVRFFWRYYSILSASASFIEEANDFFFFFVFFCVHRIKCISCVLFLFITIISPKREKKNFSFENLSLHLNAKLTFFFQAFSIQFTEEKKMSENRTMQCDRFIYIYI